jgi:hypothetical protein
MPVVAKPGATFNATGATSNSMWTTSGASSTYWYGLTFIASGTGAVGLLSIGANACYAKWDTCSFQLASSAPAGASMTVGPGGQFTGGGDFVNCSFGVGNAGHTVLWSGGNWTWRQSPNPSYVGATLPTVAIRSIANTPCTVLFEGVDFSCLGSNALINGQFNGGWFTLKNCKLHTGSLFSGPIPVAALELQIDVVNCDSGGNVARNERHSIYGDLTTSTSVYRQGGASDGSTPISHFVNLSTVAVLQKGWRPFQCIPLIIWNDVVGTPRTITLYGALSFTTNLPNNDQVYFDVEYMGDASTPLAMMATCGLSNPLAAKVPATADPGSTWVGITPTHVQFTLSVTITAQHKGYLTIYPKFSGLTSNSLYLDPLPVLS